MAGSNHTPKEIPFEKNLFETIAGYIHAHLKDPLTIRAMSARFEVSKSTLARVFKQYTGYTFHKYIEDRRLRRAMQLIKAGKRIKDVMQQTGYRNRTTFNAAFLKKFKFPPSHFVR